MLDLAILKIMCEQKNLELTHDIETEMLFEKYRPAKEYIIEHFNRYNTMPQWETVILENDLKIPKDFQIIETQEYYIDKLKTRHLRDLLQGALEQPSIKMQSDPATAFDELRKNLYDISGNFTMKKGRLINWADPNEVRQRLQEYQTRKQQRLKTGLLGIPTPWKSINEATLGIMPAQFWLIAAKLKTGKTWELGAAMSLTAYKNGFKPLLITPEISVDAMSMRKDSAYARVPYENFRAGDLQHYSEQHLINELSQLSGDQLWVGGDGLVKNTLDLELIADRVRPKIIFVDGIYILKPNDSKRMNKWERIATVGEEIHDFIHSSSIPVVVTHQYRRSVTEETLSAGAEEIGWAYELPQFAHVVIGLFSNEHLKRNRQIVIRLVESRDSQRVNILAHFDLENMDFGEIGTFIGDDIGNVSYTNLTDEIFGDGPEWENEAENETN